MIPVYIFYSMFGFQRTGDQMWALGDQLGRGFLLGATAGPHHADRRGPAAQRRPLGAARLGQPGLRGLRRGLGLRAGLHRQGRAAPDVRLDRRAPGRRGHLLLPDRLQRAVRAARRAGRLRGRQRGAGARRSCAASTGTPARRSSPAAGGGHARIHDRRAPARRRSSPPAWRLRWALDAQRLLAEDWGVARRRVVGDVLDRAAPRGAALRGVEHAAPGRRARRCPT